MKRYITAFLAGLVGMVSAFAQQIDALDILVGRMASSRLSFSCEFSIDEDGHQMGGFFDVVLQGNAYHITGDGIEIWCDGRTVWTADTEAKEVLVEKMSSDAMMAENPAWLICNIGSEFTREGKPMHGTFEGRSAKVFMMKSRLGHISANLYFDAMDDTLLGVESALPWGASLIAAVSKLKFSTAGIMSDFVPKEFSSEWIVTDLR